MIMADYFNNNLIVIVPQGIEIIMVIRVVPKFLGLES
jgi:hypothetical protein